MKRSTCSFLLLSFTEAPPNLKLHHKMGTPLQGSSIFIGKQTVFFEGILT
jgi:hypothetical protein